MNAVIALTDLLLQERSALNVEQVEHLEVIQTSGSHLLTVNYDYHACMLFGRIYHFYVYFWVFVYRLSMISWIFQN
jgi:hypothetical protein